MIETRILRAAAKWEHENGRPWARADIDGRPGLLEQFEEARLICFSGRWRDTFTMLWWLTEAGHEAAGDGALIIEEPCCRYHATGGPYADNSDWCSDDVIYCDPAIPSFLDQRKGELLAELERLGEQHTKVTLPQDVWAANQVAAETERVMTLTKKYAILAKVAREAALELRDERATMAGRRQAAGRVFETLDQEMPKDHEF